MAFRPRSQVSLSLRKTRLGKTDTGKSKDKEIAAKVKEVEKAVEIVKRDLMAKLPKQKRAGCVITKNLEAQLVPVHDDELAVA